MAASVAAAPSLIAGPRGRAAQVRRALTVPALITLLTGFALVVHGYHPYAEDGGLYLAGVKHLLNPALYSSGDLPFVTAHLRYSLFAPTLAGATRLSHLRLDTVVLLAFVTSLWATLGGVWMLASRCFARSEERIAAVLLFAAWLTLPVAGTSLILVDPYLTARSISTPAVLLLLAGTLDLRAWRCGGRLPLQSLGLTLASAAVATAFHPLMGAYGLACGGLILLLEGKRAGLTGRVALVSALVAGACLGASLLAHAAPAESAAYREAALTRSYWFLAEWRWFEDVGLVAPLLILAIATRLPLSRALRSLVRATLVAGAGATLIAAVFARTESASLAVARLQPLRVLQLVYVVIVLLLGGALGGSCCGTAGGGMRSPRLCWGCRSISRHGRPFQLPRRSS